MINQYPLWRYVLLAVVLLVGVVYSIPNLFGDDPVVQISATRTGSMDESLEEQARQALSASGITFKSLERDAKGMLLRFENTEDQLKARDALIDELIPVTNTVAPYIVALNLAPAAPAWLIDMGALPMYLGLDLRGGVHFLLEVDMEAAVVQAEERYAGDLRTTLREEKLRYRQLTRRKGEGIVVVFRNIETRDKAYSVMRREFADLDVTELEGSEPTLRATLKPQAIVDIKKFALQQNITTLRNRVNELGVAEPVVQQQGDSRIVVQLPGVQDTAAAKDLLGATATLEFRMVEESGDVRAAVGGRVPLSAKLFYERNGRPILLKKSVMLTGEYITDAASGIEQQSGTPAVFITLDGKGARLFSDRTKDKIGQRMAVVFYEHKTETRTVNGQPKKIKRVIEEVINVAVIRDRLSKRFQISGLDTTEEARKLALLLRAGALAAPIEIVEERTVGPSLGQENIDQGRQSVVLGFCLVLVFMAVYYRGFGLVANIALSANLILIVAVLSMLQATLTLPGIAGIVLTVGMAVDANVLIFERIREELRNGNTPQASIHAGYDKAFSTIMDANVTTLIAALVLFGLGTGPIKGFAITLSIGIVTSMFTAIMGTRAVINLIYGGRKLASLSI